MSSLQANRERPLSEAVRMFGEGAPIRREIMALPAQQRVATLELRIVGASNLSSRDTNGQSDPYCEAHAWCTDDPSCSHVWRTSTKLKTLNPKWDVSETMHFKSQDAMLHLMVFDWDKIGVDDFLGEAPVHLSKYVDGKWHELRLELLRLNASSGKDPVTGTLEIELRFTVDSLNEEK